MDGPGGEERVAHTRDRTPPAGGAWAGTLLTVGHGADSAARLCDRLLGAGVAQVVDIRRYPGSRAHPHLSRDALADWLPEAGIGYRWEERLGGRRRLAAAGDSVDTWWQVKAFRAYAAHTRTAEAVAALADLLADAGRTRVSVMCSESVWWRCHRRLVADVAVVARGWDVRHVMPDGSQAEHHPAAGARVRGDGAVVWDGGS